MNDQVTRSFALALAVLTSLIVAGVTGVVTYLSGESATRSVAAAGAAFATTFTLVLLAMGFLQA